MALPEKHQTVRDRDDTPHSKGTGVRRKADRILDQRAVDLGGKN